MDDADFLEILNQEIEKSYTKLHQLNYMYYFVKGIEYIRSKFVGK